MLIYIGIQCRSIFPIASDFLAHTFWHAYHLATEHHELGHSHLHEELEEMEEEEHHHSKEHAPAQKLTQENSVHLLQAFDFRFSTNILNNKYPSYVISQWDSIDLPKNTPPPKA